MVRLIADPKFRDVGSRWEGAVNLVVQDVPGTDSSQVIHIDSWHGTGRRVGFSNEEQAKAAAFQIKAPLADWKAVVTQEVGPIHAMLSGQVRVYRNLAYILRNVGGTQRMVAYEEEARSHAAVTSDVSGAVATHLLRFPRLRSGQAVQAWVKDELPRG